MRSLQAGRDLLRREGLKKGNSGPDPCPSVPHTGNVLGSARESAARFLEARSEKRTSMVDHRRQLLLGHTGPARDLAGGEILRKLKLQHV